MRELGIKPGPPLDPIEKAKKNPKSWRAAITAKCFDCEGRNADTGLRWRIGNCTIPDCPLYGFRPYQDQEGKEMPSTMAAEING
jgi:hypothetical protein